MKILVINTGSSSLKYQLFLMDKSEVLASGLVERIGEKLGIIHHKTNGREHKEERKIPNHSHAIQIVMELLTDTENGVITDKSEISAIGHRVVHGGEKFHEPCVITDEVLSAIKEHIPLAPLHNPANLTGIEACKTFFEDIQQVAVFDTAFHQSIPDYAYHYAIDHSLYDNYKIRRYGFHGTSHKYVAMKGAKFLNKDFSSSNLITIHLGNGSSIAAIRNGKSIDTSMGMTPLEGIVMGTRSGDIDPGIIFYMGRELNLHLTEIETILNKNSGLKGLCDTNDMRDLLDKKEKGDKKAELAFRIYVYRIKKYIGAYTAILGNLDAIIFTGGIGENSYDIRDAVCSNLSVFGIALDELKNKTKDKHERAIHKSDSSVQILVIPTNEELQIALETKEVLEK